MARKVLMDADSGNDDPLALMMLAAQPDIDLVALVTVAGNVPADVTARNALDLVAYLGLDIPVAQGSAPLLALYEALRKPHRSAGPWYCGASPCRREALGAAVYRAHLADAVPLPA